jgi:hypothetical protein
MSHQPHPSDAPSGASGFLDGFLPRMTANVVAMAGVALATWWMVDGQAQEQRAALDEVRAEAELLRHERDRMQALSEELAREVHDAGMEAEIAHWQLRWTEERLRRLEAEGSAAEPAPPAARRARIEPLDAPAAVFLEQQVDAVLEEAEPAAGSDRAPDDAPLTSAREAPAGGIEAVPFEPGIPGVRAAAGQRDRDRALASWKRILDEVVEAECSGRFSQAGRWRCEDERRRQLWPYTATAVECLLSGNAVPDYVADLPMANLPSHSVPLDRGALILCDGALVNL